MPVSGDVQQDLCQRHQAVAGNSAQLMKRADDQRGSDLLDGMLHRGEPNPGRSRDALTLGRWVDLGGQARREGLIEPTGRQVPGAGNCIAVQAADVVIIIIASSPAQSLCLKPA